MINNLGIGLPLRSTSYGGLYGNVSTGLVSNIVRPDGYFNTRYYNLLRPDLFFIL